MAVKTVFGKEQGNKNKQCKLIGEYEGGNLWLIVSEFNIAIEKDDVLYRLGYVGEYGVTGYEGAGGNRREVYGTKVSDKFVARYTDLAKVGKLVEEITKFCDETYKQALKKRSELLMDDTARPSHQGCNLNYFMFIGAVAKYNTVMAINAETKERREQLEAAELAKQEEQANEARAEYRKKLIADVIADEFIDAEDFVSLADEYGVKIPLRTRGWILNKMNDIKSNSLRWSPAKKSDRASDKAIPLYCEVREKVLASQ